MCNEEISRQHLFIPRLELAYRAEQEREKLFANTRNTEVNILRNQPQAVNVQMSS